MKHDKDIIAFIELLKMAAKRWPHSDREVLTKNFVPPRSVVARNVAGSLPARWRRRAETFRQA